MDWKSAFFASMVFIAPVLIFAGRALLKQYIERSVQSKFDKELEKVRSELRVKESRIASLQSTALSDRANRQALFDKRRLEALENIWKSTIGLAPLRSSAMTMTVLKLDAVESEMKRQPQMSKVLNALNAPDIKDIMKSNDGMNERPFVQPQIWALFNAYQSILSFCAMRMTAIAMGVEDSKKIFKIDKIIEIAKATMPHYSDFLDEHGEVGLALMVEPLHERLAEAIRLAIVGEDTDQESVEQTKKILKLIHEYEAEAPEMQF